MANNNYWWHRYGYTDFHELDLTWLLTQVQELLSTVETLEVRVEQCETAIEELDSRLDTAEDKIMVLEGEMDTAQDDITGLKNRVTSIEGAEIMDATMLKEVASVVPSNANVSISFAKDAYTDGVKTTTTDTATIPSATTTNAGVMLPAEKNKLNAFSVDGSGNATFTGTVAGDAPVLGGDFATKQYVDSLAISGSATVTSSALTPTSDHGTVLFNANANKIFRYGAIRMVTLSFNISNNTTAIGTNATVASVPLASSDLPPNNVVSAWSRETIGDKWFEYMVSAHDEGIFMKNRSGAIIEIGEGFSNTTVTLMWIVE